MYVCVYIYVQRAAVREAGAAATRAVELVGYRKSWGGCYVPGTGVCVCVCVCLCVCVCVCVCIIYI